jgi:hypothetical protein
VRQEFSLVAFCPLAGRACDRVGALIGTRFVVGRGSNLVGVFSINARF